MITITQYPEPIVFSMNPVIIAFESDIIESHYIHLRIIYEGKSLGIETVFNNFGIIDISNYLQIRDTYQEASFVGPYNPATSLMKVFSIEIFETENNSPEELNLITGDDIRVLQGGFSKIFSMSYSDTIINFFKNFLTWQPDRKVHRHDYCWLYYVHTSTLQFRQKLTLYFADNTTQILLADLNSLPQYSIIAINGGFYGNSLQNYETLTNKILKYEVSIIDENSVEIITPKTFYVSLEYYNNRKQFYFKNSLGGYDFISFLGVYEEIFEINKLVGSFENMTNVINSEYNQIRKANSGWLSNNFLNSKKANSYMIEFVKSTQIWEIVKEQVLIPIEITTDKYIVDKSDNYLNSLEIEYKYSVPDSKYSEL